MAELTITAANVLKGSGAVTKSGIAGATITQGQLLYIDTADSDKLKLADGNDTAAKSVLGGIALNAASSGQPITYLESGPITIGATVEVGKWYTVGTTAGAIRPLDDVASGDYAPLVGYASTAAILVVGFKNPGAAIGADIT